MKLLVSDFDGTLYQNQNIAKYAQTQVKRWQDKGNYFILATGRDLPSIMEKINSYEIDPDFIIGNNGATINKTIISKVKNASYELLKHRIINNRDLFQEIKISYIFENKIHTKKSTVSICEIKKFLEFFNEKEVIQISVKANSVHGAVEFIKANATSFPDMNFLKNIETIDIVDYSVNKLFTIQRIKKDLGILDKNIYTIGDGLNDLQMITNYQSATFPWASDEVIAVANSQVNTVGEFINQISYDLDS
ncbi:haloacid dehalogenase [Tetragenococcus halophilus subsp. flandriensis]|uniref:HAD family hydrolase n=1 Tax=Tetragenococcus halophilus TaxID=51669 RepID=UPI0023E9E016|nr:HAD family hydrolase [Tetragenococcus halophilus]GMA09060.1 haloacid dehalogenase [Tetragenococcus halophilus subsp. flandriensis]